ncbi:hypothetical protein, partial [Klebsiella michiganensis]|uniref:hypothetical protein n=1 Tax=Klebsiella michiganensis TaxID=1134687 RepID=UPI003B42AC86
MRLSLYQFRTRYRPSLFRKGTQSAQGQAGRLYFLFAEHPHLRRSAKKRRTGKPARFRITR